MEDIRNEIEQICSKLANKRNEAQSKFAVEEAMSF